MNEKRYSATLTHILALFFSLPFGIVVLAIYFEPGQGNSAGLEIFQKWALYLLLPELLLSFFAYRSILEHKRFIPFSLMLLGTGLSLAGLSVICGIYIQRDFFTATFQYILCMPAIFLYHLWSTSSTDFQKSTLRLLSTAGYILAILYSQWIMLMGYAIATRAEPRPIQALVYNVYNLLLVWVMFLLSRRIRQKSGYTVTAGRAALLIDDKDISTILGPKKIFLFYLFASAPSRHLRCSEIQTCCECDEKTAKATLCPRYRHTYNMILDMKKILEFLEIGTITTSIKRRDILSEGWKLVLFENVNMIIKKTETTSFPANTRP